VKIWEAKTAAKSLISGHWLRQDFVVNKLWSMNQTTHIRKERPSPRDAQLHETFAAVDLD
jgi:hypothetical protein